MMETWLGDVEAVAAGADEVHEEVRGEVSALRERFGAGEVRGEL